MLSPKPKTIKFFSGNLSNIKNFWNKRLARKNAKEPLKLGPKIIVWKRNSDPEKRKEINEILKTMSPKYANVIKREYRKKLLSL